MLLTLAVAAPAAFAFAHLKFFGEQLLFNYLILGLTFPFATAILPLFIKIRDLGLLDTQWGIVLPQVAFGMASTVLLMRNAFRHVPDELVEAALIDGASYPRIFWSIILPLSLPILVDRCHHHLRGQLEQLSAAAGRPQHRRQVSLAARA